MLSKLKSVFAESNNRKKKRLGLNNGFDLLSNIVDDCALFFFFLFRGMEANKIMLDWDRRQ